MISMTSMIRVSFAALVGMVVVAAAAEAMAQGPTPFSTTYQRPAVSPYTMLGTAGASTGGGGVNPGTGTMNPLVYQQLIQPRFAQEQQLVSSIQQNRQINQLQNRVSQIQRDTSARQVNEGIRATGHASTYQNLSHFYPGARR